MDKVLVAQTVDVNVPAASIPPGPEDKLLAASCLGYHQRAAPDELQAVLAAWTEATTRLQQTHEALRAEVQRLTRELEQKNRELARKNRLADLGLMASHVAHEVRNNLVPVGLYLNLLRRRLAHDREGTSILDRLEAAFRALETMVNDLLHFTRDREPKLGVIHLRAIVDDALSSLVGQLSAQKIKFVNSIPEDLTMLADEEMLRRAVVNIVLNSLDAMPGGGVVHASASADDEFVELILADSGPGFAEDIRPKVFEPFFTTKAGGTGLGLTIVMRIAEAHGGTVIAENNPNGGACIRMRIPRQAAGLRDRSKQAV